MMVTFFSISWANISLKIHYATFLSFCGGIKALVEVCPMLEVAKFISCSGVTLHHIAYLINHAHHLNTVYYIFSQHWNFDINVIENESLSNTVVSAASTAVVYLDEMFVVGCWRKRQYYLYECCRRCI